MHRLVRRITISAASIVILFLFCFNLFFSSPFVRSWDEVDFVLAVDRYDLLAMQPHFPGYPYFIAGAKLVHEWATDPVQSLIIWNAMLALSAAVPMTLLARRYIGLVPALWATVGVQSLPYLWLMGSRPMSECAGIAVLWWYLWSVRWAADCPKSNLRLGTALLLFSVLMGIRLSYFPFGIALVLLLVYQFMSLTDSSNRVRRLVMAIAAAGGAQLIWIGGLIQSEGTLQGFWKLSLAFVSGHFSEWGGGVADSKVPLGTRFVTLIADHLIRDIWFSRSSALVVLYLLLLALMGFGMWKLRGSIRDASADRKFGKWLWICLAAYGVWVLLGQNIEKPRHIAPVAGPMLLVLYAAAFKTAALLTRASGDIRRRKWYMAAAIYLALAAVIAFQIAVGAHLLKLQAEQTPAVYQLNDYMEALDQPFVLYTWEETRVLRYLEAGYEHRKILTFDYFHSLSQTGANQRVFLTDHVLNGFLQQNANAGSQVIPVAKFVSDDLFDPVYSWITLYEWIGPNEYQMEKE
ncbi:hypothetical protein [Candidatus Pristimantibacillus sp. PTI5]|uniref:hypothetical protein n=1 Tax=Candidatus Pristimantibacillus sp. PTI5 TaxID=3400422 RepID=UPI003B027342